MFYYVYSRRPTASPTPTVKEQPTPIPDTKTNEQQGQSPAEVVKQPSVNLDQQKGQTGSPPIAIIRFDSGDLDLTKQAQGDLLNIVNTMSQRPNMKVEVGGYTDNEGDPIVNLKLSVKRALFVKSYLVKLGIPDDRIIVQGYGSTNPVADNGTPEGRAQNRRVEISVKSD
jgi:outer membrane protein OmpA-like peptidoglycan-associated protein